MTVLSEHQQWRCQDKILHFSVLQHWHLRYLLFRKSLLPLRLVEFLNEMRDQYIMESDGATWRFRHRLIQDYFAWFEVGHHKFDVDQARSDGLTALMLAALRLNLVHSMRN